MSNRLILSALGLIAAASISSAQPGKENPPVFHSQFIENFSKPASEFFDFNFKRSGYDYRYYSAHQSLSEKGTDIMMYRIDPEDPAGAGKGPEIISKDYTYYGTYAARIKVPKAKDVQPNVGAVVGYFTYQVDPQMGQSEIDVEWLIADPRIIYVGAWTGIIPKHNRVGRIINLATGEIMETIYKSEDRMASGNENAYRGDFSGKQNMPKKIAPLKDFDASERFYVYGFDWYPERITWWIQNPDTFEKIILWDYVGKNVFPDQPAKTGVPVSPTKYRLNFWHTDNWPVETNPDSIEPPFYNYELEIDWMYYKPFDDLNPYLNKQ